MGLAFVKKSAALKSEYVNELTSTWAAWDSQSVDLVGMPKEHVSILHTRQKISFSIYYLIKVILYITIDELGIIANLPEPL